MSNYNKIISCSINEWKIEKSGSAMVQSLTFSFKKWQQIRDVEVFFIETDFNSVILGNSVVISSRCCWNIARIFYPIVCFIVKCFSQFNLWDKFDAFSSILRYGSKTFQIIFVFFLFVNSRVRKQCLNVSGVKGAP